MVRINIFDYLNSINNKNPENRNFEEVKQDINELKEYNIAFEHLEKSNLFEESSMHIDNDSFIQFKALAIGIKEKQEITKKLDRLSCNIELLKTITLTKDKHKKGNMFITDKIIKDDYSGINSIINELSSLKNKVDSIGNLHTNLLKSGLSLDVKALIEQDFSDKHKKINEAYNKQKNILLNLSNMFLNLTKDSIINKR